MPGRLSDSVQYLKSIGPRRAESFAKIGINSILDLLYYFPTRYLDRSTILSSVKVLQHLVNGFEGEVTIVGRVSEKEVIRYYKKQILKVRMKDQSGFFECVWFQGIKYFKDTFNEGDHFAISGKPVLTKYGHLQFAHPDFDRLAEAESKDFLNTGKIIPFYRVPKELRAANLGDFSLRRIIHQAVENYADEVRETLPDYVIQENKLLNLHSAVKNLHFPETQEALNNALHRFRFEELFYFECLVALKKSLLQHTAKGYSFKLKSEPLKKFLASLPFELTASQLKVLHEIRQDLESSKPMNRLLQGDVGSGKTIVALISMLITAFDGYQSVLMAPTEILADQHYKKIKEMVEDFGVGVSILIGGQKKSERNQNYADIKSGKSKIIIGTHALIEDNVEFDRLGLVVIDEQHRFGVLQRSELIKKGWSPDVLIMTATPIPRTLSMTLYGDLDVSVIDEMPKNRKPIKTYLRGESKLNEIYDFIISKCREGNQAFLVYPLVEESEKLELKAAESYFETLRNGALKDLRVCLIHGRMNWRDKESIMLEFSRKEYDVLVSTTVIEVGIDIPDANIIVINDAFRFGLSQLHQLRGRVGRGTAQAYCLLIGKDEYVGRSNNMSFDFEYLSDSEIERHKTIIRLNAMVKLSSGFELSEIDFKLRGPGNIFGTKQSGLPDLKYSDITRDAEILSAAKEAAFGIISADFKLSLPKNEVIRKTLLEKYSENIKLSLIA